MSSRFLVDPFTQSAPLYRVQPDRQGSGSAEQSAISGQWIFYPLNMKLVSPQGTIVALSAKEMRLIVYLLARAPHPVMRDEFIQMMGGKPEQARRVDATIYRLRIKILKRTGLAAPFKTLYGKGYQNDGMVVFGRLPDLQ